MEALNGLAIQVFRWSSLIDSHKPRFAWYHPTRSPEMNMRAGRKKKVLDIFGAWIPADDVSLNETLTLPSVLQPASKVLAWDFDPEQDEEGDAVSLLIPFSVFDHVMDVHRIDITGLNLSSTKRGNLYRTHRLMMPLGS